MSLFHKAWFGADGVIPPAELRTPAEVAVWEVSRFFHERRESVCLQKAALPQDAYEIVHERDNYIIRGEEAGLLYGTYALIRAIRTGNRIPEGFCKPRFTARMLNAWDNMDGSVERGYAGRSLWFEGGAFSYNPERIRYLGRMLSSVGINVLCINNVNVHQPAQELIGSMIPDLARFADLLRPFAIRLMVSIDFFMPLLDGLSTADPLDLTVIDWWGRRTAEIYTAIPDFYGFLIKADSENRPGPSAYGRTHSQGANLLARALRPYGGTVIWRAFVYNCKQDWRDSETDRPRAAYEQYHPLDGEFDENVILQVKNGPWDFQVREPISPLFFGMEKTRLALELQITQEYTGQQIDLFAMPPRWHEILDLLGESRPEIIVAVGNLGRDDNWTGHPLALLNLYAFGRMAWDPDAEAEEVIRSWIRETYNLPEKDETTLMRLLMMSSGVYEQYTAPLGLGWMVVPGIHYGPSPLGYEFQAWGTYNRANRDAVGIDRTEKGTGFILQYPEKIRGIYHDPETCPEELLLFFHRMPYDHLMKDGRTLIQRIYDDHFKGAEQVAEMKKTLEALPLPEEDMNIILERIMLQLDNAREWRDVINTFFFRLSGVPDEQKRKIWP